MSKKQKFKKSIKKTAQSKISILLVGLVFISCIVFLFISRNDFSREKMITHTLKSQNSFDERNVELKTGATPDILGTLDDSLATHDAKGNPTYVMCSLASCPVVYNLESRKDIDKVSISYIGASRAKDDVIFSFDGINVLDDEYIEDCDPKRGICDYYFLESKEKVKSFGIILRNATFKPYGVREVKFFKASEKGIFESVFDFLFVWDRGMAIYFVYPVLFFLLWLIPGLLVGELFSKYRKRKLDLFHTFLGSAVVLTLLFFISELFSGASFKFLIVLGLGACFYFLRSKKSFMRGFLIENKVSIAIYLVSILFLSFMMLVRDYPVTGSIEINDFVTEKSFSIAYGTYETDFLIPYQSALNYHEGGEALSEKIGGIYDITDRTPLISYFFLSYGKIFGTHPFVYQMFIAMLANLFIFGFLQISNLFFSKTKGYLIAIVFAFSNFFIFTTLFGPAKTATLFFILASAFYLLKEKKSYLMSGIFMAIAYLVHPFTLVYFLSFGALVFWESVSEFFKKDKKRLVKELATFALPVVIAFVLWSGYSAYLGDHGSIYSSVISGDTWANASKGIDEDKSGVSAGLVFEKYFWVNKFYNGLGLFCFSCDGFPEKRQLDFFRATIPGAIGIITSILIILGLVKCSFGKVSKGLDKAILKKIFIFFIISPIIFTLLYQGFFVRLGIMWYVLGIIPFIFMMLLLFHKEWILRVATLLILIENFYLIFIYDKINNERVSFFFSEERGSLFFVCLVVVSIYLILNKIISNENR
ncbi:hypothetical protein ACFL08_01520 [Patescibacteria group bacterium]